MKKVVLLLVVSLTVMAVAEAQSYEGTIQFDKKKQAAILCDYAYPAQAVENALIKRMEKLGYKPKEEKGIFNKDKGFLVFKNAYISDISAGKMDYIIKVERKSRKESDESILYLVMMTNEENAMAKMDAAGIGKAKSYLNNMVPDVEAAHLEIQITEQEAVVARAEKKLRDLKDEQSSLEKKLETNKNDQANTQKDIEEQKQKLGVLQGKRKTN
ncbi:MAG TPA: hypothetical protein VFV31_00600 [Chitinophagaceae bacterium]|nr:hypothetical protein [Chitinophagaceae bacterium]